MTDTKLEAATAPRRGGRPARLSRAKILAGALVLVDRDGADALTMRRLGAELDVEAMSLYRHVSNKQAVLDGIAELLLLEIGGTPPELAWEDATRRFATGARRVAQAHPAAFSLIGLRPLNTVAALQPIEGLLASLRRGGFGPAEAVVAYRLVMSFARGFALIELAGFTLAEGTGLTAEDVPPADLPVIRSLSQQLMREPTDAQFAAGLTTVIAGLRATLADQSAA